MYKVRAERVERDGDRCWFNVLKFCLSITKSLLENESYAKSIATVPTLPYAGFCSKYCHWLDHIHQVLVPIFQNDIMSKDVYSFDDLIIADDNIQGYIQTINHIKGWRTMSDF